MSEECNQKLGKVTKQVSDEFARRKAERPTVSHAAHYVVAYIDGMRVIHCDDRALLAELAEMRLAYRRMALQS